MSKPFYHDYVTPRGTYRNDVTGLLLVRMWLCVYGSGVASAGTPGQII